MQAIKGTSEEIILDRPTARPTGTEGGVAQYNSGLHLLRAQLRRSGLQGGPATAPSNPIHRGSGAAGARTGRCSSPRRRRKRRRWGSAALQSVWQARPTLQLGELKRGPRVTSADSTPPRRRSALREPTGPRWCSAAVPLRRPRRAEAPFRGQCTPPRAPHRQGGSTPLFKERGERHLICAFPGEKRSILSRARDHRRRAARCPGARRASAKRTRGDQRARRVRRTLSPHSNAEPSPEIPSLRAPPVIFEIAMREATGSAPSAGERQRRRVDEAPQASPPRASSTARTALP